MSGVVADVEPIAGKPVTVAICMPAGDEVKTFFAYDLGRMMSHNTSAGINQQILIATGSLVMKQRETLADTVLANGQATHILWLDTDMRFPKDLTQRLLAHEKPLVCASYTERNAPFRPVAFKSHADYSERVWPDDEPADKETGLTPIAACGFGCVLMDVNVLRFLKKPYFAVGFNPSANTYMGEDIYFFMRAYEQKFQLWLDTYLTTEIRHIGRFEYDAGHAIRARDQRIAREAVERAQKEIDGEGTEENPVSAEPASEPRLITAPVLTI